MKKKLALIAIAFVILIGTVDGTFAYFNGQNDFVSDDYSASITQTFMPPTNWTPGTVTPVDIKVTNQSLVDMNVRARYTEKWVANDGSILSGVRDNEQVALIEFGENWQLADDGYYYYTKTLNSGKNSEPFINTVTFNPNFELENTDMKCETIKTDGKIEVNCDSLDSGYAGATYTLEVIIETKQA